VYMDQKLQDYLLQYPVIAVVLVTLYLYTRQFSDKWVASIDLLRESVERLIAEVRKGDK